MPSRPFLTLLLLGPLLTAFPRGAGALELVYERSFDLPGESQLSGIEGMTLDSSSGDLILSSGVPRLERITTDGDYVGPILLDSDAVVAPDGLQARSGGRILSGNMALVSEFEGATGEAAAGGISLELAPGFTDIEGITFDPVTETIWVVANTEARVASYSTTGAFLSEFSTSGIGVEPHGVVFDPVTGNLLIVEDESNSLHVVTLSGAELDDFDLSALASLSNVEAVTLDPETRTVYAGGNTTVAVFTLVPEPATGLLVVVGLAALARARPASRSRR